MYKKSLKIPKVIRIRKSNKDRAQWPKEKELKEKQRLIDWCLMPTLEIFKLYCGVRDEVRLHIKSVQPYFLKHLLLPNVHCKGK